MRIGLGSDDHGREVDLDGQYEMPAGAGIVYVLLGGVEDPPPEGEHIGL